MRLVGCLAALLASVFSPTFAHAQASLFPEYEPEPDSGTSRPVLETPNRVLTLEHSTAIPPCGGTWWGRSTLDGGLASRRRPDEFPCRTVWDSTVRVELGVVGGVATDRSDGGWGGLSLALGLRFPNAFRVYFLSILVAGGWDTPDGTDLAAASWNSFLLELSPFRGLAIGVGPSIDVEGGCRVGGGQVPSGCFYGPAYGAHARLTGELVTVPGAGLTLTTDAHFSGVDGSPAATVLVGFGLRL